MIIKKIKKHRKKLKIKTKKSIKKFKYEITRSLNTAIVAAFGFLIALVWRDVIVEYVEVISSMSPVKGKFISAIIITLISILGILIITKFLPLGKN